MYGGMKYDGNDSNRFKFDTYNINSWINGDVEQ